MKNYIICFFILISVSLKAQVQDTLRMNAQDSTLLYSIQLDEIVVSKNDISGLDEERKKLLILKRRVYKTYPYAKLTSEKLLQLNATMAKLQTKKEKKKYFKNMFNTLKSSPNFFDDYYESSREVH